ncbi:MAG: O-antigen ligase family protein [Spirochaetales bacterium]|nr:O-antigen ligase family protein [Leptospiraceae bacterium]MCP5483115.1 O-antigen ligase family protein [Spirochaetales bacterium]MCP5484555.1 O-antigen ligase family protein [Spirochaetales bacterium]
MRPRWGTSLLVTAFIAGSGFWVNSEARVRDEYASGLIVFVLFLLLVFRFTRLRAWSARIFTPDNLVLLVAGAALSVQSVSNTIDTEIPRLKLVLRLLFVFHLAWIVWWSVRGAGLGERFLGTALLFTAFPFNWMHVLSGIPAVILCFTAVYVALRKRERVAGAIRQLQRERLLGFSLLLLALGMFGSQVWKGDIVRSAPVGFLLAGAIAVFLCVREGDEHEVLRPVMVSYGISLLFVGAAFLGAGLESGSLDAVLSKRTSVGGVNTNDIGGYAVLMLPLVFTHVEDRRLRVSLVVLSLVLLAASIARLSWATFFFVVWAAFFFGPGKGKAWVRVALILGLGLAIGVLGWLLLQGGEPILQTRTLWLRLQFWDLGWRVLEANPLFGVGPEQPMALASMPLAPADLARMPDLRQAFFEHGATYHVHSTFLQLALEGGLFHLFGYCLLLALFVLFTLRCKTRTTKQLGLGLSALGFLVQGTLNYHLFQPTYLFGLWCILGLGFRSLRSEEGRALQAGPLLRKAVVITGALVLALGSYFAAVAYAMDGALEELHGMRLRDRFGNVLLSGSAGQNSERLESASELLKWGLWLAPHSAAMHQLQAELRAGLEDDSGARFHYRLCAESSTAPAYCLEKLAMLSPSSEARLALRSAAQIHDPFRLLETGPLGNF